MQVPTQYLLDAVISQRDGALNECARLKAELRAALEEIDRLKAEPEGEECSTSE